MALAPGSIVDNRFTIIEVIGEGGMATAYKAEQFGVKRHVALKLMHLSLEQSPEQRERFLREAQVLSQMSHAGIVQFLHFGMTAEGSPYLVMELCSGRTLRALLDDEEKLPWERAVKIAAQIADALSHAHKLGVVHRDLTPQNIFVDSSSGSDHIKLIDFGLATFAAGGKDTLTPTGALVGSVRYMSPEQSKGQKADSRSDIYALGCIMLEMLTGHPPFDSDSAIGLLFKHENESRPRLVIAGLAGSIQKVLDDLIGACMNKRASARPSAEALSAIFKLLESSDFEGARTELSAFEPEETAGAGGRHRLWWRWALPAGGVFCLVAGMLVISSRHQEPPVVQDPASISGLELKSLSMEKAFDIIRTGGLSYPQAKDFLARWFERQSIRPENAPVYYDEAVRQAQSFERQKNHRLETLAYLLAVKASSLFLKDSEQMNLLLNGYHRSVLNSGDGSARSDYYALNHSTFPLIDRTVVEENLLSRHLMLAMGARDFALGQKLVLESLNRRLTTAEEDALMSASLQIAAQLETEPTKMELRSWLRGTAPFFRRVASSDSLTKRQTEYLQGMLNFADNEEPNSTLRELWSLLKPEQQRAFIQEVAAGFDPSEIHAMNDDFDKAVAHCLKTAKYFAAKNESLNELESLRVAVQWQDMALQRKKQIPDLHDQVYSQIEKLFQEIAWNNPMYIQTRVEATAVQEARIGKVGRAVSLYDSIVESPKFSSLPRAVQDNMRKAQSEFHNAQAAQPMSSSEATGKVK